MNDAQILLVEAAIRRALPPGRVCQQILRNHGYAIDFRTTSFTGSISGALRIWPQPLRSNNYIIVSLKSTGALKAIRVDPRDMQSLRLPNSSGLLCATSAFSVSLW